MLEVAARGPWLDSFSKLACIFGLYRALKTVGVFGLWVREMSCSLCRAVVT